MQTGMQMMPPRIADPSQAFYMASPAMRLPSSGQFAPMGNTGRGQSFGYATRPNPGSGGGGHMYAQPMPQMYNNPGTQPAKGGQQQQQGGGRQMPSVRPAMMGSPGGPAVSYMGSVPAAPAPAKPKSRAIAIVDPETNEALVVEPVSKPAGSSAESPSSASPAILPAPAAAVLTPAAAIEMTPAAAVEMAPSPAVELAPSPAPSDAVEISAPKVPPPTGAVEAAPSTDIAAPVEDAAAALSAEALKAAKATTVAPQSPPVAAPPSPASQSLPAAAPAARQTSGPASNPASVEDAPIPPKSPIASDKAPAPAPAQAVEAPVPSPVRVQPSEDNKDAGEESGDDWESKDESQLILEPITPDKPKLAPPVSLRPGGVMAFASSTKVSAASANGKKTYDREFLLQFQPACLKKPDSLPDMDVLIIGPGGEERPAGKVGKGAAPSSAAPLVGGQDDWRKATPSRAPASGKAGFDPRGGNSSFGKSGGDRGRGGDRRDQGRGAKGGARGPVIEVKPLLQSDNRWKPADHSKVDDLEKLLRTTKALLNKFTPEKLAKLTEQFLELEINSRSDMVAVIDLVFDKALFEPIFGYMYAELCVRCAEKFPEFKDELNPTAKPHTFKRLLLNKCQEEFEKENNIASAMADLPEDATAEDREMLRKRTKARMLGNIRFIGELYKKKMLTEKIMHECLIKLLGEVENPDEDEIECLCKLLTTIGKMIDHPKAKPHMDQYFVRMQEMAGNHNLANRMRFMLQEVIELRRGSWIARKPVATPAADDAGKGKGSRIQAGSGDIRKELGGRALGKGAAVPLVGRGGRSSLDDGFTSVGSKGAKGGKGEATKGGEASASAPAAPSAAPPKPVKKLTKEELQEKIEGNLEEYFSGAGVDELVQCTRDLQSKASEPDVLGVLLMEAARSKGFDARSEDVRSKCAKVVGALCRAGLLNSEQATTGFTESLEFVEDDLCDIPHIATYQAEFIAAAVHDGAIKLSFINSAFTHLLESETIPASTMACNVLIALRSLLDNDARLREIYASEVQLANCLPAERNSQAELAQLLESRGLSFIDPKVRLVLKCARRELGAEVAKAREEEQLRALEAYLKDKMGDMDGANGSSDDDIWAWMSENATSSLATARTVMRCVLETVPPSSGDPKSSALKLCKSIERRATLLKKSNSPDSGEQLKRQTECLFEVQRYCLTAHWPQGLAKMLFYKLCKPLRFEPRMEIGKAVGQN
ncbi:MAG: hypothetical protein SGPRY_000977 [Prymnesium sp.]